MGGGLYASEWLTRMPMSLVATMMCIRMSVDVEMACSSIALNPCITARLVKTQSCKSSLLATHLLEKTDEDLVHDLR